MVEILKVDWLAKAALDHAQVRRTFDPQTNFMRGSRSINEIDRMLPDLAADPNILIVGLGLSASPVECCTEPQRIAAHLEGLGIKPRMTLVDIDPRVTGDVPRERIYSGHSSLSGNLKKNLEAAWETYLRDTKQEGRVVYEIEDGLVISPWLRTSVNSDMLEAHLKRGINAANTPASFQEGLATGKVRVVTDDVAETELRDFGPFDYIEMLNVLNQIDSAGQKLAMANASNALRPGGRMLINDISIQSERSVMKESGGWLDKRKLNQLGLTPIRIDPDQYHRLEVLLEKQRRRKLFGWI